MLFSSRLPQHGGGIEARRAPGRNEARRESEPGREERDGGERPRIARTDAEQLGGKETGGGDSARESERETDGDPSGGAARDEAEDVRARRAERDPDPELAAPLEDGVRRDAAGG